ncbi:hypothetical protein DM02DRAFT_648021 [Periconia macrospinosa]|uniref:3-beta hydroxysteroid dehydrogenase/isomerase domain-containing protein n=1 Tax=Periconia macrospinosa TaxID=97972 RepID=A0A2V1EDT8_9PLEO|nr:hypothetical protein DM02DRAFT_648021 [Periconia macrospinosa]
MGDLGSVFVVGGCGLLGHHIVKYLVERGDATKVTVFDVSTKFNRIEDSMLEYVTGSITSRDDAFFLTNGDPWSFWDFLRTVSGLIGKPLADKDIWTIPLGLVAFFTIIFEWVTWVATLGGQPSITTNMLKYTAQVRTSNIFKARE